MQHFWVGFEKQAIKLPRPRILEAKEFLKKKVQKLQKLWRNPDAEFEARRGMERIDRDLQRPRKIGPTKRSEGGGGL